MKIPQPNTTVTVLHNETERVVIVHDVSIELGTMWRVWVAAPEGVFANGDTVHWLEDGKRHSTFVRDLQRGDGMVMFALVAGEEW